MKKIIITFVAFFTLIFFLRYPSTITDGAILGLKISSNIIIPSLFPFCVICLFIVKSDCLRFIENFISPFSLKLFKLTSNEFFVMIMSFIGGYPVGAKLINNLYKNNQIDKSTATVMMCYCVNAGPAFIIIAVGNCILNSRILGNVLLVSHITGSIIIAFVCRFFIKIKSENIIIKKNISSVSDIFVESTADACTTVISICSFVVLFNVVINVINNLNIPFFKKIIIPLLEITSGIMSCKNIYVISMLLAWGGICVHFQLFSAAKGLKINKLYFYISRIAHSLLSFIITYIQLKLLPIHIQTLSNNINFFNSFTSMSNIYASVFFILSSLVLVGSVYFRKY